MRPKGIVVLAYAFLVLVGGIIGYVKAQSAVSLMTGVLSSLFLSISAFSLFKGKRIGFFFSLLLTGLLTAFFAYRLLMSHSFMPAGLMCLVSLAVLATLLACKRKQISQKS
jgi:uncharacterized membrane protein (UPF0136 family)